MPLLHLVPPALALVRYHRRLFHKHPRLRSKQLRQTGLCPRHRRIKLPPRENSSVRLLPARMLHMRLQLPRHLAALQRLARRRPRPRQPRIDRLQQLLRRRRLRQRKQQHMLHRVRGPLRLRIKSSDRLNLIPKKIDPHRPLHLRPIHIHNAPPHRHLPRHLHHIHPRVPHLQQVLDQHLRDVLLALAHLQRQRRIVVAPKQPHTRGFHRRNHQSRLTFRDLPKRGRPLLLDLPMRRQVLKRQHIMRRQPQHFTRLQRPSQITGRQNRCMQRLRRLVI